MLGNPLLADSLSGQLYASFTHLECLLKNFTSRLLTFGSTDLNSSINAISAGVTSFFETTKLMDLTFTTAADNINWYIDCLDFCLITFYCLTIVVGLMTAVATVLFKCTNSAVKVADAVDDQQS